MMLQKFCGPYISCKPSDSTAIEAGSSVDEKLKGHGPEAVSFLISDVLIFRTPRYFRCSLPTIFITDERKSSGASDSWKNAGEISSGRFSLCNSSTGTLQCSFTAAHTRRFSEGIREYPSMTRRGLWPAHAAGIAVESLAANTSKPAFSSTFLRTSARPGSRDTTRIFSFSVTHNGMLCRMSQLYF